MNTTLDPFTEYRNSLRDIERQFELDVIAANAFAAEKHKEAMVRREERIDEARLRFARQHPPSYPAYPPGCEGCKQLESLGYEAEEIAGAHGISQSYNVGSVHHEGEQFNGTTA